MSATEKSRPGRFRITMSGPFEDAACLVVEGLVVGNWHGVNEDRYGTWQITHLPTGAALGLPFKSRAAAVRVAAGLARIRGWAFWHPSDVSPALAAKAAAVRGFKPTPSHEAKIKERRRG